VTRNLPASASATRARRPTAARFAAVAALLLLSACGGPGATPGLELTLGSASVTVTRGTATEVPVTVTRLGGAAGPVGLSIVGLPPGVSASFSPATQGGGALASTLSLSAAAAASEGATTLTVVATGGAASTEAALQLDVRSLTVAGRVEGALSRPFVGATVTSQGRTAFTDAAGAFILGGLAVPYDLTVSSALGGGWLHVYEGMTSPTPTFRPTFAGLDTPLPTHAATVTASIVGGALGTNEVARVCVEGVAVPVYGCSTVITGASGFSIAAKWFDGTLATVRLHAFRAGVNNIGRVDAYLGYATALVDIVDGGVALADLDFDPVGAATLRVATGYPATLSDAGLFALARFGPHLGMPLFNPSVAGGDVEVLVPVLPGLTYDVVLVAADPDPVIAWKRAVGLDAGDLVVSAPAKLDAPGAGAIDVDLDTPFATTPTNGAVTYLWGPVTAGPFIALTTTRSPATVPDPTRVGLTYPAGLAYSWSILGHGDGDVDEAAAGGYADFVSTVFTLDGMGGPGFDASRTYSRDSAERTFTFAP